MRRLTPNPRGKRPSSAALTRVGQRKARDKVMRIERSVFPSRREGFDCLIGAPRQVVEPTMSVAKRVDEDRARFGSHRPHRGGSFALTLDNLAPPVGRGRRPGNDEDAIVVVSRCALGKLDLDRRSRHDDSLDGCPQVGVETDSAKRRIGKIGWPAGNARASLSGVQCARALTIRSRRGRAQGFCDPSLNLERRHARHGPGFLFPSLQDRLRDIVAPSPLALGRVARAHPVAMIVKKLAPRRTRCASPSTATKDQGPTEKDRCPVPSG